MVRLCSVHSTNNRFFLPGLETSQLVLRSTPWLKQRRKQPLQAPRSRFHALASVSVPARPSIGLHEPSAIRPSPQLNLVFPHPAPLNPTRGVQSGDPAAGQTNRGAQPLLVHAGFSFLTDPVPTVSLRTSGVFVSAEYALTVPLRLQGLCTLHPLAWVRPKGPWPSLAGNGKNGVLRPDYGRRS